MQKLPSNKSNRHAGGRGNHAPTAFASIVYHIVSEIPDGETRTYKQIATAAGRPRAFRAVGNILNKNTDPTVPCHRVVRSDGKSGGYAFGENKKSALLKDEATGKPTLIKRKKIFKGPRT